LAGDTAVWSGTELLVFGRAEGGAESRLGACPLLPIMYPQPIWTGSRIVLLTWGAEWFDGGEVNPWRKGAPAPRDHSREAHRKAARQR
jgi:hypothetical protein